MTTLCLTLCLLLAQTAPTAPKPDAPHLQVTEDNQNITLSYDPAGATLLEVVQAMSRLLGWSLQFQPEDLQPDRVFATAPQTMPRDQLVDYFFTVLRGHDLFVTTIGDGAATLRSVVRIGKGKPGMLKSLAPFVAAEDLVARKPIKSPLVTTQITLANVDARELATSLTGYFADQLIESVRNVENANALLMTGWASTLRNIITLATTIDEMAGTVAKRPAVNKQLEERVGQLEKRIAGLEEALRNVGQAVSKK